MTAVPAVVHTYGMGVDSTALMLRWISEPDTRLCDLRDLLVVTAQTGDEWPVTGTLVTQYMLPLFREHGIRWVQVARRGPRQADGITILSDSRAPDTVHLAGDYRLSQEMLAAGTVPQAGGARKCSAKAKGWPLDEFIGQEIHGEPYLHVVGFESGETSRALRDARFNTTTRTGVYPLIEWGWDRQRCEDYIWDRLGVRWVKSACVYCPFALLNQAGRRRVLDAYRHEPGAGITGLVMEHLSVSLNPRQGLVGGERLASLLARAPGQQHTLAAFQEAVQRMPWRLYEVRRAVLPRVGDAGKTGRSARWLRTCGSGTKEQMRAALAAVAAREGLRVTAEDGIPRAWMRRRGEHLPAADWFYVAAPEGAHRKEGPGFAAAWPLALAGPHQGQLFEETIA